MNSECIINVERLGTDCDCANQITGSCFESRIKNTTKSVVMLDACYHNTARDKAPTSDTRNNTARKCIPEQKFPFAELRPYTYVYANS
jgi:hypothetical protein